jgi:hypothetical protein
MLMGFDDAAVDGYAVVIQLTLLAAVGVSQKTIFS